MWNKKPNEKGDGVKENGSSRHKSPANNKERNTPSCAVSPILHVDIKLITAQFKVRFSELVAGA